MAEKRRGLGRGLGALISSSPATTTEGDEKATVSRKTVAPVKLPTTTARKSASPATKRTALPAVAPTKKARPVDMFFVPGKTEEEAAEESAKTADLDSTAPIQSNSGSSKKRRAQMPLLSKPGSARLAESTTDEDSLIPSDNELVLVPGARFLEIPVGNIHPNRKQPRTHFDEEHMSELVHSIKEVGLLQPIVVRPSTESGDKEFELVMGERRWRATQAAGLDVIPAIVRETQDVDLLRDALLENLHRSQLNPLEEAAAYQQLLQEFGCTQDELSERIGRSRPQISNTIRLMKLPALVQRRVAAGVLSAGHARALLALADPAGMEELAQRIVNEGLSVRATEEIVALSDGIRRPKRDGKPSPSARHERLDFLANALSDRLDTNVKISLGARKGKVSIEFASVDDLNRIMAVMAPGS